MAGIESDAPDGKPRCWWHGGHEDYRQYHDTEWGRPVSSDTRIFEKLCLEAFQSGLSWLTILRKRDNFREAFAGFDMEKVAAFGKRDVDRLLKDAGIVRHRMKIESVIHNASRAVELAEEEGSLAGYFWRFEPGPEARPRRMNHKALMQLGKTPESTSLSKDLKKRGWKFLGPTTVYAAMQAMGLVNDHLEGCAFREVVEKERKRFKRPR